MKDSNTGLGVAGALFRLAAGATVLLALLACGGPAGEPAASPTPPPGMFSTLPTTEPPIVGDRPPTIELNTPEPTFTPQPTHTLNPTYTPVPTPLTQRALLCLHRSPLRRLCPRQTPQRRLNQRIRLCPHTLLYHSHACSNGHSYSDGDTVLHGDACADTHTRTSLWRMQKPLGCCNQRN